MAGTWRYELMKKPWRSTVSCLLPMDFSACFIFIKDQFLRGGIIPSELNLPHKLLNKKKKSIQAFLQEIFLWSHFLNLDSLSQMIFLCQDYIKNQATIFITN